MTTSVVRTSATPLATDTDPLVGIWSLDEGYQITELLFRSDGHYQLDTTSQNADSITH
jgi:hypothetical protein